jgi:hypothetical protein
MQPVIAQTAWYDSDVHPIASCGLNPLPAAPRRPSSGLDDAAVQLGRVPRPLPDDDSLDRLGAELRP